ncbi:MAG: guanylate kinase [Patescibacteria group bacterium]|nr:hypothetical protein [Candidatus Saccharibacteria bacterium]MDQ5963035.1 guanylate kinase [Patescibacteria group bacterium]
MVVILQNKEKFVEILDRYEPSGEARQIIATMPLVTLQGISGAGRNTIIDYMTASGKYHTIVSDTTRPPKVRDGALEQNGVQYFFRSEEQVLADLEKGLFLEAELIHDQQVSGISIRELKRAHESGKIPINEVALEGCRNIELAKPDTIFCFVVPPSYDTWISRITDREVMSEAELANRITSAQKEIEEALGTERFHFVVNDTIENAAAWIDAIVDGQVPKKSDEVGRKLAEKLLQDIRAHHA